MAARSRGELIEYYKKTDDYCAHWKELGVLLGIEMPKLKVIEANNPRNAITCHMEMLDLWLKRNPANPNPEEVLDIALRKLRKKDTNGEKSYYCVSLIIIIYCRISSFNTCTSFVLLVVTEL